MKMFLHLKHAAPGSGGDAVGVVEADSSSARVVYSSFVMVECCPQFKIGFLPLLSFAGRSLHCGCL